MAVDVRSRLGISDEALAEFCRKWKIVRLELFGSALREDFDPERSDLDLLVTFAGDAGWSLFDELDMEKEFGALVGREVDMPTRGEVEKLENYLRRRHILQSARTIYELA